MKNTLLLAAALLLALTVTAAAQQKQTPPPDRDKIEKERSASFKKVAPLLAEQERHAAIIRDLIDTCIKCRDLSMSAFDALDNPEKVRNIDRRTEQCNMILEAKLAQTPLYVLAPLTQPMKGVDVEMAKWRAINIICDAYQYALERAKRPIED